VGIFLWARYPCTALHASHRGTSPIRKHYRGTSPVRRLTSSEASQGCLAHKKASLEVNLLEHPPREQRVLDPEPEYG